ncbi:MULTISPECIES: phytanoyl-CoA dioxygenase family protein [Acidiphilium]|uniref:phytanoyl-CoA dioxygenase family protein n=1 Tax=Acidiphilium TaxID=522 RepID=UPI00257A052A|nr:MULTISPECIES: phytanoyl-CoA dioxygenase family protein [Acidiphilium]
MTQDDGAGLEQPDERYDEDYYLMVNPEVVNGVAAGYFVNGYHHYRLHGRGEGRICAPVFDAAWYGRSYPIVTRDIENGRARDAWDHWRRIGRYRGYLPNPCAPRPENPSRMTARFGRTWTGAPDAGDTIAGRYAIGALSDADAGLLRDWVTNGYVILPGAIQAHLLDAACTDLDRAYQGGMPSLLFQCLSLSPNDMLWRPEINARPAKALDLHWHSQATRDLMFAPAILRFLHLIFERPPLASQSLGFLRGAAQPAHQDTAYVVYSQARRFAASWIALEDVTEGAGELAYFPGSQQAPDFIYAERYKSLREAMRMNIAGDHSLHEVEEQHGRTIIRHAEERGLREECLLAKAGDVLIWHADLAHGGKPILNNATRRSVVTHYCPPDVAPLSFEAGRCDLRRHETSGYYSTVVY